MALGRQKPLNRTTKVDIKHKLENLLKLELKKKKTTKSKKTGLG